METEEIWKLIEQGFGGVYESTDKEDIHKYNMDLSFLIKEIKRLRNKLFEAEVHIDPLTDDYTFENDIKELHYIEEEMIE